jgi:hypothetical protein
MKTDRIDGISAYCDRWCERCAFTMRCSTYAVHVATAMCEGDFEAALQLAVGRPPVPNQEPEPEPEWRRDLPNLEVSDKELEEFSRLEEARRERLDRVPVTTVADAMTRLALGWLDTHRDALHKHATKEIGDALDVVSWDVYLIAAKIHRALDGRDRSRQGEDHDDHPVQNDWNGSAKVALISIARSAAAWDTIAGVTGDTEAARLGEELRNLAREVEREFPKAWKFIRPGFDAAAPRKRWWRQP